MVFWDVTRGSFIETYQCFRRIVKVLEFIFHQKKCLYLVPLDFIYPEC